MPTLSALHGCEEAVRLLLDRCAFPPDTRDSCGTTPLMDALRAGHTRTAQLLIDKHGASRSFAFTENNLSELL